MKTLIDNFPGEQWFIDIRHAGFLVKALRRGGYRYERLMWVSDAGNSASTRWRDSFTPRRIWWTIRKRLRLNLYIERNPWAWGITFMWSITPWLTKTLDKRGSFFDTVCVGRAWTPGKVATHRFIDKKALARYYHRLQTEDVPLDERSGGPLSRFGQLWARSAVRRLSAPIQLGRSATDRTRYEKLLLFVLCL